MAKKIKQKKSISLFLPLLLILSGLVLLVVVIRSQQQARTEAIRSTSFSFSPPTTVTSPFQLTLNTPQTVSIVINPGVNQVSYAKLELLYDPTKISIPTGGVTPLLPTFTILESSYSPGKILIAFSIGPDTANVISMPTAIANVQLTPIGKTFKSPTQLSFGSNTLVLSIASTDTSSENVLSNTIPFYAMISAPKGRKK